jgi:predicted enzyme related to lactoylglutathione lyase
MTRDVPAAAAFYQTVFGWDRQPGVGPEADGDGVFCGEDGEVVAGIGRIPPGVELAPLWLVHFVTEDVEAAVSAVRTQGGSVLHPVRDRSGFGRSAIVADPTGAVFSVCQLEPEPIGPSVQNEQGALITVDLRSSDANRARGFYAGVFGFSYHVFDETPGYTAIAAPGSADSIGGIGELDPEEDLGDSSHWLVYLSLDTDTDGAALKARWSGGQVLLGPYDAGDSRSAMLADPQGALFAMIGETDYPRLG